VTNGLPVAEWRILWFSPNAGLWETSQLEHDFANGLVSQGAQVTVIRCRGLFNTFCPVMQANQLNILHSASQKKAICKECRSIEAASRSVAKYSTLWLDDYVTHEMKDRITDEVNEVNRSNWQETSRRTIPVNRYSTYLSMLHHKVSDVTVSEVAWNEYVSDLRNSLMALEALPSIFAEVDPTHGFVYNPLYPTNRMFTELVLADPDIQYVGLSAGAFVADRYSTIALYRSVQSSQTAVDSPSLMESLETPLTRLEVELVSRNLGHLIQGRDPWVYSTPPTFMGMTEIQRKLGTTGYKPIAVVLIGSPDETRSSALVGAEFERVPIDQVSSVTEFIKQALQAARNSPEIDFVFRLHPRLAPNKRESLRSPDLDVIEELLSQRGTNVFLNSPGDGIGLYDVARIATFGINHASSAGLEFLALGIPVIHYDPPRLNAYPPSLGWEVSRHNDQEFIDAVNIAAKTPRSIDIAIRAWRWYAVVLVRTITHKSWEQRPASVQEVEPQQNYLAARRLIPVSLRERISRKLSSRNRAKLIQANKETNDSGLWVEECIDRIATFDNSIVWNPEVIVRGDSLSGEQEKSVIQSHLEEINRIIGASHNTYK
jgi:hypothetical protein